MRSLLIVGGIILLMIIAKVFFFKKDDAGQGPGGGGAPSGPSGAGGGAGKSGGKAMPADVFIAKLMTNKNEIYASGTMLANEEVELRFEGQGRLTRLLIAEGSSVVKGQLIAKINDADILARLKKNKLEAELAVQIEARQKKLLDINAISKEEYDISSNKVGTLNADKEALEVALAQTELRAPFGGKIGLKNISNGAYVNTSTVIAELVQSNPIKIDYSIPEKYSNKVRKGSKINFSLDGSSEKVGATVIAIDPKIDENLRTLKVRASTPNSFGKFFPGQSAKVSTQLDESKSIMVPTEIVVPFVGGKKLYVLKNGKAIEKTVITGLRTEKYVEVAEGIAVGDTIVASAVMNVKDGQGIKVKKVINQ
jgi:membrane fusion protein, multidrug efflux system